MLLFLLGFSIGVIIGVLYTSIRYKRQEAAKLKRLQQLQKDVRKYQAWLNRR